MSPVLHYTTRNLSADILSVHVRDSRMVFVKKFKYLSEKLAELAHLSLWLQLPLLYQHYLFVTT